MTKPNHLKTHAKQGRPQDPSGKWPISDFLKLALTSSFTVTAMFISIRYQVSGIINVIKFLSAIGCDTKFCPVLTNHSQVNKHLVPYSVQY